MSLAVAPLGSAGAPVSFSGVASGLNTQAIIQAELAPQTSILAQYQAQIGQLTSADTAWQTLLQDLQALGAQAQTLQTSQTFQARTAQSSAPNVVTAQASAGAPTGSYALQVTALAQAQESVSTGSATDPTATVFGTGTLTIQVGTASPVSVTIGPGQNSLTGIAAAINGSGAGVTASVINTGTGYKLLLSGTQTGAASSFTVTDGLSGGSVTLGPFSTIQAAQNAQVTFGSGSGAITVTSATNTITGLLPGVTLTLGSTGSATVTVAQDTASEVNAVQAFVTAYNQVVKDITTQNAYTPATGQTGGPLFGDPLLDTIFRALGTSVMQTVSTAPSDASTLLVVGAQLQSDGTLTLDTAKLTSVLQSDPAGVATLMQGLGASLSATLGAYDTATTGLIPQVLQTNQSRIQTLSQTITQLQQQIAQEQQILQQEFIAMERAVSQAQGLSQLFLQAALAGVPAAASSPSSSGSSSAAALGLML